MEDRTAKSKQGKGGATTMNRDAEFDSVHMRKAALAWRARPKVSSI